MENWRNRVLEGYQGLRESFRGVLEREEMLDEILKKSKETKNSNNALDTRHTRSRWNLYEEARNGPFSTFYKAVLAALKPVLPRLFRATVKAAVNYQIMTLILTNVRIVLIQSYLVLIEVFTDPFITAVLIQLTSG